MGFELGDEIDVDTFETNFLKLGSIVKDGEISQIYLNALAGKREDYYHIEPLDNGSMEVKGRVSSEDYWPH